ncbi:hypothetical protein GJ496_000580 [Pomphorhynchus laevis]|nr:hypothetical protein GJ496_000580 [Pomphorhynchus laevis]
MLFLNFTELGRFNYFVQSSQRLNESVRGYLTVYVYMQKWMVIIADILGWIYFVLWSFSFYPQIILNHRRKSVVGLNFDFVYINLIGFALFTIFNCLIFFKGAVQEEYFVLNPHSPLPVEVNDVVFAAHAAALCAITAIQCNIFDKGDQRISAYGYFFIVVSFIVVVLVGILVAAKKFSLLTYIFIFSYIKLASTLAKYIPQVYFNFRRRSTVGWSISAILLDIIGGFCSFAQQFIIAINFAKWSVVYGNMVKLLLAIASIIFDVIFILQHYVLYRNVKETNLSYSVADNSPEDADLNKSKSKILYVSSSSNSMSKEPELISEASTTSDQRFDDKSELIK